MVLLLLLVFVALGAWVVAAARSGLEARTDLEAARAELAAGERLLRDGDLRAASMHFQRSSAAAAEAERRLGRASVRPLGLLPVVGPNLEAAQLLSVAVADVAGAAASFLDVGSELRSADARPDDGRLSLGHVTALTSPARHLADQLLSHTAAVESIDPVPLVEPVRDARSEYLRTARPITDSAALAADLLDVVPALLGVDRPRTYLVAAAALSEIRAGGGLLGSWALVTLDDGDLQIGGFFDPDQHPVPEVPVPAPSDDFARRYAPYDALRQWRNVNLTPDFPTGAEVLLDIWEAGGGDPVDGVVMVDAVAYAQLAARAGGLDVPGFGTLTPDDALRFVALDAYDVFDDDEQRKAVLGAVAASAFAEVFAVLEGDDVRASMALLGDLVAGGHLRVHVRDDEVAAVLDRAHVTGRLGARAGESFGVFTSNIAGNKLDWFVSRALEHEVELRPGGAARSVHTVTFRNEAPTDGHGRVVLGPWTESAQAGDAISMLTATCSVSCRFSELGPDLRDGGLELGRPMVDTRVWLRSGEERSFTFTTESDEAWVLVDDHVVVDVEHLVQTTLHGSSLVVRVPVPAGTRAVDLPDGARVEGGEVVYRDEHASGRVGLRFVFEPLVPVASR